MTERDPHEVPDAPDVPAPETADEAAADEATAADLEAARRECEELMDRLKRTAADYQNYQKRTARRIEDAVQGAVRMVVLDLLPVIDNFERALDAAETGGADEGFRQGVVLVHDQLLAALAKHDVRPIEAEGLEFDPEHHEAVGRAPGDEVPENHVAEVLQRGYRMGDRTIRPSRVIVSSGPAGSV